MSDTIARAAEVIGRVYQDGWNNVRAAEQLAADCLLAGPPDDTTTKLIEAAIAFAGPTGNIVALFAAVDAYLAAHPEATP